MKKQNGFTIIELFIALAMIMILFAISIPAYKKYQMAEAEKARQALVARKVAEAQQGELPEEVEGFQLIGKKN